MINQKLSEIVDIFKCCIFNWSAPVTIVPAFLIAAAIIAFLPSISLNRYLGAGSRKFVAYPFAAISGMIIPTCSCNIVPIFASILKCGAGIGPAFAFLYAGPAISLISTIFTFKVIGPLLGVWRIIGVFSISILIGLLMEKIFPAASGGVNKTGEPASCLHTTSIAGKGRVAALFIILFAILIAGSSATDVSSADIIDKRYMYLKFGLLFVFLASLFALVGAKFKRAEVLDWMLQAWKLVKTIVPLFIISILIVGLIAKYVDVRWIHNILSAKKDALGNRLFFPTLSTTFSGTVLGELMYFPILSEIVFVKGFLKLGMDIGPAMAILLAGPGTSLPGFILISRFVGWRKMGVYFVISVVLELVFSTALAMSLGDYICACLNLK